MALQQKNRLLNLATPLGDDVLLLSSFLGNEEFSGLFSYQLQLISDDPEIKPQDLVGAPIGWSIVLPDQSRRHWHGFVNGLVRGSVAKDGRRNYKAEVVPWFWFLTQTNDCRIFQNKKVPDIINEVLGDFGFANFKTDFRLEHAEWEYCVQYRESDFNFLSRLMEKEGIFYYFKHSEGSHQLVMTDHFDGYYDCPESKVDLPINVGSKAVTDHLTSWERRYQFVPGKYAQRDYNFETPSTDLLTETQTVLDLPGIKDFEVYDYPGQYPKKGVGNVETKLRIEGKESRYDVVSGSSLCKTFQVGGKFQVGNHPDTTESGAKVVITNVTHSGSESMGYESGAAAAFDYRNTFQCIPAERVFRPNNSTRKPAIHGIQTAIVTGPEGEEIYPDEFGRVKCQFHWDRYGKKDDESSCWIRVSQSHAGADFGAMDIPRIGNEVVVSFLEGDPDRPLITGRVYHAENMPHYPLPDHKTRTTFRSRSTKEGEGFNELTFEDLKDEERVYIQAQKNIDTRVLNDSKSLIYGHRHQVIGYGKEGEKEGDQKELVYRDKHLNIKRNQIEKIEGNLTLCIGEGEADRGGQMDVVIEKDRFESIGGENHRTVGKNECVDIGGSQSEIIGSNQQVKVGMSQAVEAGQEIHLKAGMKVVIEAGVQLSLVAPGGFIDIGPAGVFIKGTMVMINSGGAAGSGSGCSPDNPQSAEKAAPDEPEEAWEPET